jgi:hypothetical protein
MREKPKKREKILKTPKILRNWKKIGKIEKKNFFH